MGLVERAALVSRLSPPLDRTLTELMIEEFISLEKRFVLRDWEPAELDGGQYAEIVARILYHLDSRSYSPARGFDDCIKYIEDSNASISHAITPRYHALHIARVLRTIYKFRNQRGAVHISPTYTANHMDSKLMVECGRWTTIEMIRLYAQVTQQEAEKIIRELLEFDVPCIGKYENALLVQRIDLNTEEEILVLLHYAGEIGLSRKELGQYAQRTPPSITTTLQKLISPSHRQIILTSEAKYRLTDLGSKRVRDQLAEKLLLE